jgi:sphingomyelin phosphodiesterase acid-like 3
MADDSAAADDAPSSSMIAGSHRFLWLSDVHLDPMYGTPLAFAASYYPDADCGAGMSADADDDAAAPYYFGRYGCDSPPALVGGALDAAIEAFETTSSGGEEGGGGRRQRPSLVIVTGDAIRHGIDQIFSGGDFSEGAESKADNGTTTTSSEAKAGDEAGDEAASAPWHEAAMDEAGKVVRSFASIMRTSFPDSVIVYALGNNDVVPDYYLALFDDVVVDDDGVAREEGIATIPTPGTAGMLGVLYDALVVGGDDDDDDDDDVSILTSADASTFLAGGYYSRTIHDGSLVVLSLNTILYSSFHEPIMRHRDIDDPGGQFAWMRKILSGCRREVETCRSAMIVGHVPPAMGSFRHQQLWREGYIRT